MALSLYMCVMEFIVLLLLLILLSGERNIREVLGEIQVQNTFRSTANEEDGDNWWIVFGSVTVPCKSSNAQENAVPESDRSYLLRAHMMKVAT